MACRSLSTSRRFTSRSLLVLLGMWVTLGCGRGNILPHSRSEPDFSEDQKLAHNVEEEENEMLSRFGRPPPDLRLMLSGVLRWQDMASRLSEVRTQGSPLLLSQGRHIRVPGLLGEDKFSGLPPGFIGTRGKRTQAAEQDAQDRRELPVFSNGFPAVRG